MRLRSHARRVLMALAAAVVFVLVPTAAQAAPSFYQGPIFGITTGNDGRLLVADAAQGVVDGDTGELIAFLPGITDVTPIAGTDHHWAITGGGPGVEDRQFLYLIDGAGNVTQVADLWAYEEKHNPHPAAQPDSNPFDVADLGGGEALVADAGGNDLLKVDKHGKVKLVAVFPDELVSTENVKTLFGCPAGPPPICNLPPMIPAQPVATSVAIGPDGAYYVGELKGFPAPLGESRVWRVAPNARNAKCGQSPDCSVVLDGFTSIIDLAFGPDGRLYIAQIDDQSWFALELALEGFPITLGGSVHACNLSTKVCESVVSGEPVLTSITFRADGLWGATNSFFPGTDVTRLLP